MLLLPTTTAVLALPLGGMNNMRNLSGGFIRAPPCLRRAPLGLKLGAVVRLLRVLGSVTMWGVIVTGVLLMRGVIWHVLYTIG